MIDYRLGKGIRISIIFNKCFKGLIAPTSKIENLIEIFGLRKSNQSWQEYSTPKAKDVQKYIYFISFSSFYRGLRNMFLNKINNFE